jgi:hypothetical protein
VHSWAIVKVGCAKGKKKRLWNTALKQWYSLKMKNIEFFLAKNLISTYGTYYNNK